MKKSIRPFIAGCLTTLSLVGLVGTAMATVGSRPVTVDYNDIKVTLDGKAVDLVDANGNAVEPFAIAGTTYLPIRAVASALGLDVGWDSATSTAVLTTKTGTTTTTNTSTSTGTVIMDEHGVKVTFLGFEEETGYIEGYKINLRIENTSDTDYTVQVRDLSVNGIMADSIFSCDVAAGKTANDYIHVYNMEESGINAPITTAEFKLHVFDWDDWNNYFDTDAITVS